jgi:hypothetical protein
MWQDVILTIGSFLFSVALIPTIQGPVKPPLRTSLVTGLTLVVFAICYVTLGLYLAALSGALTAGAWLLLAWQRISLKGN